MLRADYRFWRDVANLAFRGKLASLEPEQRDAQR